jgi:hypothetical protein
VAAGGGAGAGAIDGDGAERGAGAVNDDGAERGGQHIGFFPVVVGARAPSQRGLRLRRCRGRERRLMSCRGRGLAVLACRGRRWQWPR